MLHKIDLMGQNTIQIVSNSCTYGTRNSLASFLVNQPSGTSSPTLFPLRHLPSVPVTSHGEQPWRGRVWSE